MIDFAMIKSNLHAPTFFLRSHTLTKRLIIIQIYLLYVFISLIHFCFFKTL